MKKDDTTEFHSFNPDTSGLTESAEYKRKKEQEDRVKASRVTVWQRISGFFANRRTHIAFGVAMMLIGIYFLLVFMSYLAVGAADQSRVENYDLISNATESSQIGNAGAALGASVAEALVAQGFGLGAFVIVVWFITIAVRLMRQGCRVRFFLFSLMSLYSMFACSMVVGVFTRDIPITFFQLGGAFGYQANLWLERLTGAYGMWAVNLFIVVVWVLLCYKTLHVIFSKAHKHLQRVRMMNASGEEASTSTFLGDKHKAKAENASPVQAAPAPNRNTAPAAETDAPGATAADLEPLPEVEPSTPAVTPTPVGRREPVGSTTAPAPVAHGGTGDGTKAPADDGKAAVMKGIEASEHVTNPNDPTGEYNHYVFPPLDLMNKVKMRTDRVDLDEQEANKQRITDTLNNYGIGIKSIKASVGPTVTLFEIVPQDGIRIAKIRGLEDDIAMSLAALGIRIIAPMPGRGTIGIEVPNREPQVVPIYEVLSSKAFQESKAALPMVLGCTVSNDVFVVDLAKMPHLLVAGATGQGKSVGLNTIITSLLYKKGPSELKFILVDPKKVEFSPYADLEKYFFAKVPGEEKCIATDKDKVVLTLNSVVQEMENRYQVLEEVKERNVIDYNRKWRQGLRNEKDSHGNYYKYMPYIVVIIDEFADLIMEAGKEIETPIIRVAQKGRAAGLHMIIATQRPSANVVTGLIRSNFPARMAFRVAQGLDSRIILDRQGAQQLIGRGDMLFSANSEITRLQCPFVDTPDVENLCRFVKEQEDADHDINHLEPYQLPECLVPDSDDGGAAGGANLNDRDPIFEEAVRWVVQSETASTSSLQRRYQIGFNRAGRIMDQMEAAGIVGPSQGGKPRKVLMDVMQVDMMFGAKG